MEKILRKEKQWFYKYINADDIIMTLTSKANIQILKKPTEVYNTIINPSHLTQFFISESSGPLETGKEVLWKFPEFDDRFPITQVKTETNNCLLYTSPSPRDRG